MTLLVVIVLAVLLAAIGGAVALALTGRRNYRQAGVIVPGADTGAPPEWAGAHTAEARLHRRIRDAIRGLRAADDEGLLSECIALEGEALALDERLVAVAALPERVRSAPLEQVERAVTALEDAVGAAVAGSSGGPLRLEEAADDLAGRAARLAEARAELERMAPPELREAPRSPPPSEPGVG